MATRSVIDFNLNSTRQCIELPRNSGTYLLVLDLSLKTTINIGALGPCHFEHGYYLYVGSAFGPGGIRARVERHLRKHKKHRWHIDYFRAHCNVVFVLFSQSVKLEHNWVNILEQISKPVCKGFGSTDSPAYSHLFLTDNQAIFSSFGPDLLCFYP